MSNLPGLNLPGLNLSDLAQLHEDMPIGESFIRLQGISTEHALDIVSRFPKLVGFSKGFKLADLIAVAPGAVAAIIASATNRHGDPEAEKLASAIPIELQMDILETVGRLTFKKGFGPFAERLLALAGGAAISKPENSTGERSTKSPLELKLSSPTDIPPQ